MKKEITRRGFIKGAAAASAGFALPYYIPSSALGGPGKLPASERITLGFIGVGGMGSAHLHGFKNNSQVEILGICDVDEKARAGALKAVGKTCAEYEDFRELLDRGDVDAVVISTPDHWHALACAHACWAGKDILCEKPLTLTIGEAQSLVKIVRRYGRVFQTGSQQRSSEEFRRACSIVRSNKIGRIVKVDVGIGSGPVSDWATDEKPPKGLNWDLWLGPAPHVPFNPLRHPYTFRWFYDYSGGKMTDWGAHHLDIVQWALDKDFSGPVAFEGEGTFPTRGLFDTALDFEVRFKYRTGERVICHSRSNGIKFYGTEGTVYVRRGHLSTEPGYLKDAPVRAGDVDLFKSPGHHQNWLDCIRTREKPVCDVAIGAGSVIVCHLCNIALRSGQKLAWDPEAGTFPDNKMAERWIHKPYRAPWRL